MINQVHPLRGRRRTHKAGEAEKLTRTSRPTGNLNPPVLDPKEVRQIRRLSREYSWPLSWLSYTFGIAENPVVQILEGRSYRHVRREWVGRVPWEELDERRRNHEGR